eukprot:12484408-Ditylum_brightwellii.AAC.1
MEEQSHHCNTRTMRQKTPRREPKTYNGGSQSLLLQTALSVLHLSQRKGGDSCDGKVMTAAIAE